MKNLVGVASKALDFADDSTESAEERQATLSKRHASDMSSDSWLSKAIRPVSLLWLFALETLIIILDATGYKIDTDTKIQVGVLLFGAFGFYFQSRKAEKVAAQNAKANIEIEKLKTKQALKLEKKEANHEKWLERRKERKQDKED